MRGGASSGDGIAWRTAIEELVTDELRSLDVLLLSLLR